MAEEIRPSVPKMVRANFVDDAHLATHYVNVVNVRSGQEEFFFTLGTAVPVEVTDMKDLDAIDLIDVHTLFRFAVSRSVMKQMIDIMQNTYDKQIDRKSVV